jgi:hypothetical protein
MKDGNGETLERFGFAALSAIVGINSEQAVTAPFFVL